MKRNRRQEQITPNQLFAENSFLGRGVAEEFTKARLEERSGKVSIKPKREAISYGRNAGAIEITSGASLFRSHAFSEPDIFSGRDTRAHTERVLFRDALDEVVPIDFTEQGIRRPSQMSRVSGDPRRVDKEVLKAVTDNATGFKQYMDSTRSVVKLFSERVPCGKGSQRGCNKFLDNILPETDDTAVGFFTKKTNETGAVQEVKRFTEELKTEYQSHLEREFSDETMAEIEKAMDRTRHERGDRNSTDD